MQCALRESLEREAAQLAYREVQQAATDTLTRLQKGGAELEERHKKIEEAIGKLNEKINSATEAMDKARQSPSPCRLPFDSAFQLSQSSWVRRDRAHTCAQQAQASQ